MIGRGYGNVSPRKSSRTLLPLSPRRPPTVNACARVEAWKIVPGGFKWTQHLIGNHVIAAQGDRAPCIAHLQATHLLFSDTGGNTWTPRDLNNT